MAFENMPTVLQPIFQQNMLDRAFQRQLGAMNAYRKSTYRCPVPQRNGETMIYSRAGRISPVLADLTPSANTNYDNGVTAGGIGAAAPTFPFEQFAVTIGMRPYFLDLNLIQNEQVVASLFQQNIENLGENAALSLDLYAASTAFKAYLSGSTWITAATTASTTAHVDNVYGLDTAFQTFTINSNTFAGGLPQTTSPTYPQVCTVYPFSGATPYSVTVNSLTVDGSNTSTMGVYGSQYLGASGTLTFSGAQTFAKGDVIVANDAPRIYRPNGKQSSYNLAATDTMGAQLIINAVAELRANGVKPPLPDGTYPCYIDPIVDAQFFTDSQYQIMSQGCIDSEFFANARLSRTFGVTFVPTTNAPSFNFTNSSGTNLVARHAIVCGDSYLQESPFDGTYAAISKMPDMGVADYRYLDGDIVLVNRLPLDRAGQILSMGWYWIGGFVAPTDITITPAVVPSASGARYKRAVPIQVASAR